MRAGTRDVSTPPDSVRLTLTVHNGVSAKLHQMLNVTALVLFIQGPTRSYAPPTPNLLELTHQQNTRETRKRQDRRAHDVRRAPARMRTALGRPCSLPGSPRVIAARRRLRWHSQTAPRRSQPLRLLAAPLCTPFADFRVPQRRQLPASRGSGTVL